MFTNEQIARGNDELRKRTGLPLPLPLPGTAGIPVVVTTSGVNASPDLLDILQAVREFDNFTPDNDPYKEHDCAVIKRQGKENVIFKIDYYDQALVFGVDPYEEVPRRVLTIMLGSEY